MRCIVRIIQFLPVIILIWCQVALAGDPRTPPPARVVVAQIGQEDVARNEPFLGLLYYDRVSHISTEVPGLVDQITVRAGDRVTKGEPLVRLNTELHDNMITFSKTKIKQINLRIRQAERDYKRMKSLYADKGTSQKNYEDAEFALRNARIEKQAAEVALEQLLIEQRKSVITAPFDGIVLEKNVDSGDWVQQGRQLVSIGSTHDLFVRVPIAETGLQFITFGREAPVRINAFHKELTGVIVDLAPVADAKTKNVFLKIRIPALTMAAENMSATVFLPVSRKQQLRTIPRDALVKFQGKDFVYTVKEGKAAILPVNIVTYLGDKIGADNPYFVPGMKVVVEGNERLRPDQPVTVVGEK